MAATDLLLLLQLEDMEEQVMLVATEPAAAEAVAMLEVPMEGLVTVDMAVAVLQVMEAIAPVTIVVKEEVDTGVAVATVVEEEVELSAMVAEAIEADMEAIHKVAAVEEADIKAAIVVEIVVAEVEADEEEEVDVVEVAEMVIGVVLTQVVGT